MDRERARSNKELRKQGKIRRELRGSENGDKKKEQKESSRKKDVDNENEGNIRG